MERFKDKVDGITPALAAAKRRVKDQEFHSLTTEEVDGLATRLLARPTLATTPNIRASDILRSSEYRRYLKDLKFLVNLTNGQTTSLEDQVRFSIDESFSTINSLQKEANGVDSTVKEEEIKVYGGWSAVHLNEFTRTNDMGLDSSDPTWIIDWKTGLPFLPENIASIRDGFGMLLPFSGFESVPIIDAVLIGEETDFGDAGGLLVSNDPRNVLIPGKTFMHVIAKREFDDRGVLYTRNPSVCTMQLEFGSVSVLNHLMINPLSSSPTQVTELSYITESGDEIDIPIVTIENTTSIEIFFEPIRARYLRIRFEQSASVEHTSITQFNQRTRAVNRLLTGVGFSHLLDEDDAVETHGRVHDLSIESIKASLYIYTGLGIFRSQPVWVTNPIGFSFDRTIETVQPNGVVQVFGEDLAGPEGDTLQEAYIGVHLESKDGAVQLHELIPIPDQPTTQVEYLPIIGTTAKVKLFPDTRSQMPSFRVTTAVIDTGTLLITTAEPHGISPAEYVGFWGPVGHPLDSEFLVTTVPSTTSFRLSITSSLYVVADNQIPYTYVYRVVDVVPSWTVFQDGVPLVLDTDYRYSLDSGSSWLADYPISGAFTPLLRDPIAGKFMIRIENPVHDSLYWIEYRYAREQSLVSSGKIKLGGNTISIGLQGTKGYLSTVLVSRSDRANQYVSPITTRYILKVKESVT